jgi:hypothetical protein
VKSPRAARSPRARFTVILEYRNGTYISQVLASDPREALQRWARSSELLAIKALGTIARRRLVANVEDMAHEDGPTPFSGLVSAWCAGMLIPGALVNIIKTAPADRRGARR